MAAGTIRVAMIARPDLYRVPGGDTIQITETAKALTAKGVAADIITECVTDYSHYDLLHFFNIIDPEDILGHVYKSKLPYVVSTIYVDYSEYDSKHRAGALGLLSKAVPRDTVEYIKTLGKFLLRGERVSTKKFFLKGHKSSIRYILEHAGVLLPNSENEYRRLRKDYGIEKNYIVVPNAINPEIFEGYSEPTERDIILCVARIEGRKNQLNVIRALNGLPYKVVFIGPASPNQASYVELCKLEAASNIEFIDQLTQHQLLAYYKRARVHVLASWFETTGLSNLEAAVMGANLVLGDRGDVRDYFGEYALYCDPGNAESIREAVTKAWNSPFPEELRKHIFNNFTWKQAAEKTHEAYKELLRK